MLGVDAFVVTFVNREFVIYFPFQMDATSEGDFLEIVAIAEVGPIGSAIELGRSATLTLRVRRGLRNVDSTSTSGTTGKSVQYRDSTMGNRIAFHENFLFQGALIQGPLPAEITLDPVPLSASSMGLAFQPYLPGAMQILLTTELASMTLPPDAFLQKTFPFQTLPTFKPQLLAQIKTQIAIVLRSIFIDAGFTGMKVSWSDEPAGAAQFAELTSAFGPPNINKAAWHLLDPAKPLIAPFWHFFITGTTDLKGAGVGEAETYALDTVAPRQIGAATVFVPMTVPIGSGTKPLAAVTRILPTPFADKITIGDNNTVRLFKGRSDFDAALAVMSTQIAIVVAHEIGHSLGLMHLSRIENGTYDEKAAGALVTIMSQSVEQGAIALDMKFHPQAKQMWKASFGVSPTFTDTTLQNKTWTDAEVDRVEWPVRSQRLHDKHHVKRIDFPDLSSGKTPTPFSKAGGQKGTAP